MKIQYNIKGVIIEEHELAKMHEYYEAARTAEYILDGCECVKDEEQALKLGYEVREVMASTNCDEMSALEEVLERTFKKEFDEIFEA